MELDFCQLHPLQHPIILNLILLPRQTLLLANYVCKKLFLLYREQGKPSNFNYSLSYSIILLKYMPIFTGIWTPQHWVLNQNIMYFSIALTKKLLGGDIYSFITSLKLFTVHMCIVSKSIVSQPKFSIRIVSRGMRIVTPLTMIGMYSC